MDISLVITGALVTLVGYSVGFYIGQRHTHANDVTEIRDFIIKALNKLERLADEDKRTAANAAKYGFGIGLLEGVLERITPERPEND